MTPAYAAQKIGEVAQGLVIEFFEETIDALERPPRGL